MFFPDDKVIVKIQVDNSRNTRDILSIGCALRYTIRIKKSAHDSFQDLNFDLNLLQFDGVPRNRKKDTLEFVFDLKEIFTDFSEAKSS